MTRPGQFGSGAPVFPAAGDPKTETEDRDPVRDERLRGGGLGGHGESFPNEESHECRDCTIIHAASQHCVRRKGRDPLPSFDPLKIRIFKISSSMIEILRIMFSRTILESPMRAPAFITFTGADERTDISALESLCRDWPVEIGILFSKSRSPSPRYPSLDWISGLADRGLRLSAHLCGAWAVEVATQGTSEVEPLLAPFSRVQINIRFRSSRLLPLP
jgi:hypothetical protein